MSRLVAWLDRLILSKNAPLIFLVIALLGLGALGWSWLSSRSPTLVVIPQPDLARAEPLVRDQLRSATADCESIAQQKSISLRIKARAFGQLGQFYLAYHYGESAAACFENAVRLDPEDFHWYHGLAHAYSTTSQWELARQAMVECQRRILANPLVDRRILAPVYSFLGDWELKLENSSQAAHWFNEALKVDSKNLFALIQLARIDVRSQRISKGIERYQQAYALQSQSPEIRRELANALRQNQDRAGAERILAQGEMDDQSVVLEIHDPLLKSIDQLNISVHKRMQEGLGLANVGRLSLARKYLKYCVEHQPDNVLARVNLGTVLTRLGNDTEAQSQFEAAFKLEPGNEIAVSGLCLNLARMKTPSSREQALQMCQNWRRERSDTAIALQLHAQVCATLEMHAESLQIYEESQRKRPTEHWPRLGRATQLAALGRRAEARKELETSMEIFPKVRDFPDNLARFLATCPDAAVRDQTKALKLAQNLYQSKPTIVRGETLAAAYAEAGQYEKAVTQMRETIKSARVLDAEDTEFLRRLEQSLHKFEAKQPLREPWPFATLALSQKI